MSAEKRPYRTNVDIFIERNFSSSIYKFSALNIFVTETFTSDGLFFACCFTSHAYIFLHHEAKKIKNLVNLNIV